MIATAFANLLSAQGRIIGTPTTGGNLTEYGYSVAGWGVGFLVGAPQTNNNAGAATVHSSQGSVTRSHIGGLASSGENGRSVGNVGDLTGDGVDEYVVGCPGRSVGGPQRGGFDLHDGATGNLLVSYNALVDQKRIGLKSTGLFESTAGSSGTFAVSGLGEFILCDWGTSGLTTTPIALAGTANATAEGCGDFSGKGFGNDIAFRVNNTIEVHDASGATWTLPASAPRGDAICFIPNLSILAGGTTGPALAVSGTSGVGGRGRVEIYRYGVNTPVMTIIGNTIGDRLGLSMDAADLDGNGSDDLVISANDGTFGYVKVYDGLTGIHPRDAVTVATGTFTNVSITADVNGDGFPDLVVGTTRANGSGTVEQMYGGPYGRISSHTNQCMTSPFLTLSAPPIPLTTVQFQLFNTQMGDICSLYVGGFDPSGTSIGLCEDLFLSSPQLIVTSTRGMNGPWQSPPILLPLSAMGVELGYQVFLDRSGVFSLSRAMSMTVGW